MITDSRRQEFLEKVQKAETKIKKLIVMAMLTLLPLFILRGRIKAAVETLSKEMGDDVMDKGAYLVGLMQSSERMIKAYEPLKEEAQKVAAPLIEKKIITPKQGSTPLNLIQTIAKADEGERKKMDTAIRDLWGEAKAVPCIEGYERKIKDRIGGASKFEFYPRTDGKKPITIWQKAELDIRHEAQEDMLRKARESGETLYWLSSHPNCSKRCAKWQGKLVDVQRHADAPGFRIKGKVDGNQVYSLTDIMAQKDRYGYENNIISGFNCRHRLIKYEGHPAEPEHYTAEEIQKQREIESQLRAYERKIRQLNQEAEMFKGVKPKEYRLAKAKAGKLTEEYKRFAHENGYPWHEYRIKA